MAAATSVEATVAGAKAVVERAEVAS